MLSPMNFTCAGVTLSGLQSFLQSNRDVLASITLILLAVILRQWTKGRLQTVGTSLGERLGQGSNNKEPRQRTFGEWTAVSFTYPEITPYEKELVDIKPVPYRPFRWGPYHVTMGIRNMSWNDWIELDNQYERYQRIRAYRIGTRGGKVVRVLGNNPGVVRGGGEAAIELVHELAEYLSKRYPSSFHVTRHDQRNIKTITVVPLGETHELPLNLDEGEDAAERAMTISALLIQDDLAIMIEGTLNFYFRKFSHCNSCR